MDTGGAVQRLPWRQREKEEVAITPRSGGLQGRLSGLLLPLALLIMVVEVSTAKECRDGFYKTPRGVCCELCPAGTYKVVDCRADGKSALCEPCPMGRFMNRDNQEEMCTWCSNCGPGEEVAHACSMDQDTVCRCTEGLSRDGDSGVCLPEEPHPARTIVLPFVITIVLIAAGILLLRCRRKRICSTLKSMPRKSTLKRSRTLTTAKNDETMMSTRKMVDHEHEAVTLIRGNRDNLVDWIGVDPSPLLNHLKDSRMIPHDVHRAAKATLGDECAELILNHFMNQGEMGCIQLWDALCSVRLQYEQLQQWILENGEAVSSVRKMKNYLTSWIGENPLPLLKHLKRKGLISSFILTNATVITNGAEHTELLLNNFIERGDDDCLKLLLALKAEQDQYPTLKKWLDSLEFL
ncbi:uncharacterized protein LOC144733025 [Lampetra planeri]